MKLAFDIDSCMLELFEKTRGETITLKLSRFTELPEGVEVDKENTYLVFDQRGGTIYVGDCEKGPYEPVGEVILSEADSRYINSMLMH